MNIRQIVAFLKEHNIGTDLEAQLVTIACELESIMDDGVTALKVYDVLSNHLPFTDSEELMDTAIKLIQNTI